MIALNKHLPLLALCAALALPAATVRADAEKTLEDAGLNRAGLEFVIDAETEVLRGKREIQLAERELDRAQKDFRTAERKIAQAQNYIAGLQRRIDELADKARRARTQDEYADHLKLRDQLIQTIEVSQEERKAFEKDQQVKLDDARANYISTMVTWVEKAQAVSDAYAELAADEKIQSAIETLSEKDKRRYVLGPSRRFDSMQRQLAKAAEEYQRGAVDLRKEGNVMMIDVRVNGKPIRTMILDTGASSISLPFLFAKDLGIEPSNTDPIVQVQMADGKIVDAWKISLETVQVGEFVVNDVEALILPESLHAAPALLGNSFLGNFTFEIDPDRGKLILSRLTKQ